MRFEGRTAIVTGGARGIGEATAQRLAAEGARVAVVDRDADVAEAVAKGIGENAMALACDVANGAEVDATVAAVVDRFGGVDILVCCAGITRDNLLFRMTDEDWSSVVATHLTGSFLFARAAQAEMTKARYGKIVFLSSTSAMGNRGQTNYSAVKAGLQGMARTLAIELGPFGINVNAVAPGFVETRMTAGVAERLGVSFEDFKKAALERIPRRILGQPSHIASIIAFLCSDDAVYVSGETIYASGGPRSA
jgi:3-oxoacyl-[acyl-carrier protein] reductase